MNRENGSSFYTQELKTKKENLFYSFYDPTQ